MNRLILLIIAASAFAGCSKTTENIIWERSFGNGKALFVAAAGDTGIVSCGESGGKQFLLWLDEDMNIRLEYSTENTGHLNKVWAGPGYFITAGSTGGRMYLSKVDNSGTLIWDSIFTTTFRIDHTSLCYLGGSDFLAIGSVNPDSLYAGSTGLSFVWFNANGNITRRTDQPSASFIAALDAITDNTGNIYLALTKQGAGSKTKAAIAKYTSNLIFQWEKEISNNPSFGAASVSIILDASNNPIVTGRTELQASTGVENNTFVTRYIFATPTDSVTRKYLEYANFGSCIIHDPNGQYMVLNAACNIINFLDNDLNVTGIIRTYSSCDSQTTDTFGYSIALDPFGNILIAGTKGGGYYIALKSSGALSPV